MAVINQTNRTLLMEQINPEKLDLLTLVGDVKEVDSLTDEKIKEINDNLLVKSFDEFLDLPYFVGAEKAQTPEAAIIGAEKGCDWIKQCLDYYENRSFVKEDGSLDIRKLPEIMVEQIQKLKPVRVLSLDDSLNIRNLDMQKEVLEFNDVFFSPKVFDSREVDITPYTCAIHHYQNSWFSPKAKAYYRSRAFLVKVFGLPFVRKAEKLLMPRRFK